MDALQSERDPPPGKRPASDCCRYSLGVSRAPSPKPESVAELSAQVEAHVLAVGDVPDLHLDRIRTATYLAWPWLRSSTLQFSSIRGHTYTNCTKMKKWIFLDQILWEANCVYALKESEIKNGDQQTEALEIDFVIDLEMYRNWQKMEISKISITYYQKSKCFTEIFVSLLYAA